MKIFSKTSRIVARSLATFFVVAGLSVGMVAQASAGTDNGTGNWYKHDYFHTKYTPGCPLSYISYDQVLNISNYDINHPTYEQRYNFSMSWDNAPRYHRPYSLEIDGKKFGDYPSSQRSGTLYDGTLDMNGISTHTFHAWWNIGEGRLLDCTWTY